MSSYLEIVYNERNKPRTDYPNQLTEYLFKRFEMKQGQKLLDAGCGRGEFTAEFAKLGLAAKGIDLENVEKDKLPFPDNNFDFVFSKSLLEHLWKPDNFMEEGLRILKPGGIIIIMTPDWYSQRDIFYDDHTHVHPYTPRGLSDLMQIKDFKEAQAEKFY